MRRIIPEVTFNKKAPFAICTKCCVKSKTYSVRGNEIVCHTCLAAERKAVRDKKQKASDAEYLLRLRWQKLGRVV